MSLPDAPAPDDLRRRHHHHHPVPAPPAPSAVASSQLALHADLDQVLPPALDDLVLSSLHDLHFVLSPSTTILRVSANCLHLLGCEPNLLVGQRLAALVHKDDAHIFSEELDDAMLRPVNPPYAVTAPVRPPFRFYCRIRSVVQVGSDYSAFELIGHYQVKMPASLSPLQLMIPPPGIISITARPAFSRKGRLLDGMLELKMEQIRLVALLREMRREAAASAALNRGEDDDHDDDHDDDQDNEAAVLTVSTDSTPVHHSLQHAEEVLYWRPEPRTSPSGRPLKRSRSSPPRLTWVTSPIAPPQPQPPPQRVQDQDQSQSDSDDSAESPSDRQAIEEDLSNDPSAKVKVGDAGIPFFIRPEGYERKISDIPRQPKRKFAAKEYCCSRCGTVESPEWRAGPDGPKTLCNACGLKYAKEQKRAKNAIGDIKSE